MQALHASVTDAHLPPPSLTRRGGARRATSLWVVPALTLLLAVSATPAPAQTPVQPPTQTPRKPASTPVPSTPATPAAPASAVAQVSLAERTLVGTWYGESGFTGATGASGAQLQRFLTTRRADGTYSLEVRTYENGKPTVRLTNTGLWGISNGLFFTVTTEVDGRQTAIREPTYTAAYLVRSIGGNEFAYQHIGSGRELQVVRTGPDTRLPD